MNDSYGNDNPTGGGPGYGGYHPGSPWWGGGPWGPPPPPHGSGLTGPPRHRWYQRPIVVAAMVAATVAASAGLGHALWPTGASNLASASAPGASSGGEGSTNPFSGSGGTGPFNGSGGTGSLGGGSAPAGSGSGVSPSDVSSIAAKVDPALVDINVTFDGQVPGAGTGIVLTGNGEVLTNNHVVEGATSISVTDIGNGRTYGATVVGYDRTDDVAVIQLAKASGLQTAKIGNSSGVAVGDAVVAIGNAGGAGGTPTATGGSVTGLNQAITASDQLSGTSENLSGLIETNANIQPGDSGGSLVDSSGRVIGMDTAASQGFSLSAQTSQGYAIPINKALSIASEIESGHASSTVHVGPTAFLGVMVSSSRSSSPYGSGTYDPFGGQNGNPNTSGALVQGVVSGGPAARAGLTAGDVITSLGGRNVTSASDLTTLLQEYEPGNSVQLGWTDTSGSSHTGTVTLGSGPAQ
jgi:S1-C subfamily serine protease